MASPLSVGRRCVLVEHVASRNGVGRPMVILLGGVPGTGKTTVANELVRELGLSHHISTGFIRAAITHLLPEAQARLLRHHSYDAFEALSRSETNGHSRLLEGAVQQSVLLRPAIEACVRRAVGEGISMVLEGSHFIPGVLDPDPLGANLLCVLDVPDREELKHRVLGPNHSRRQLSPAQLERLVKLQECILDQAQAHGRPVVTNTDLSKAVSDIRKMVEARRLIATA